MIVVVVVVDCHNQAPVALRLLLVVVVQQWTVLVKKVVLGSKLQFQTDGCKLPTEDITSAQSFNFAIKFPTCRFLFQIFVALKENFSTGLYF